MGGPPIGPRLPIAVSHEPSCGCVKPLTHRHAWREVAPLRTDRFGSLRRAQARCRGRSGRLAAKREKLGYLPSQGLNAAAHLAAAFRRGFAMVASSPDRAFRRISAGGHFISAQLDHWGKVVKSSGIKMHQ
jgi:hypothetical protein